MFKSFTHVLESALRLLESELVAQPKLDVPVIKFLIIICTDTEMPNFLNFRIDFTQNPSNLSAKVGD